MTGASQCINNAKKQIRAMQKAARGSLDKSAETIHDLAKNELCPVDTSTLKNTAENAIVTSTTKKHHRRISFGKGIAYAFWVHEKPVSHFNPPTATWKFLKIALDRHTQSFYTDMESVVRQAIA